MIIDEKSGHEITTKLREISTGNITFRHYEGVINKVSIFLKGQYFKWSRWQQGFDGKSFNGIGLRIPKIAWMEPLIEKSFFFYF